LGTTAHALAGRSTCRNDANSRRPPAPDGRRLAAFGLMPPGTTRRGARARLLDPWHRGDPSARRTKPICRARAVPDPYHCGWRGAQIVAAEAAEDARSDRAGGGVTPDEANHRTLIRALSIANSSSRTLSRASCEKNFRLRRIILRRTRAHASRIKKIAAQACRDFASRSSEVKKTLEPCGFLHCRRNPSVARKISCATRADATRCIAIT
jgi:hypothetical protein